MGYFLEKKYWNVLYVYSFRENEGKRNYEFCLMNNAKITSKIDQVLYACIEKIRNAGKRDYFR